MQENLPIKAGSQKLKGMLDEINICIFTTSDDKKQKNFSGLMPNTKVDEDGTIWFLTNRKSRKINEIESNGAVHLLYTHPSKNAYVDVWGKARMVEDGIKISEMWNPVTSALFPGGQDKSQACLIRVEPEKVNYWDSRTNESVCVI
jgi:general stress protein 26